jgi:hypothetical protein
MLSRSLSSCFLGEVPVPLSPGVDMVFMPSMASPCSIEMLPYSVTGNIVSIVEDKPHNGSAIRLGKFLPYTV